MDLSSKRVLVIGVGGLGSPAALVLVRAGVGHLTLVDDDQVDESNLHRQILFGDRDIGRSKAQVAVERLAPLALPGRTFTAVESRLDAGNARALIRGHDLVLDGSDNFETKFLVSDIAMRMGVPLVNAGVLRFEGQLLPIVRGGPCLRCVFEREPAPEDAPSCAQVGVLGAAAGVIGTLQAAVGLALLRDEPVNPALRVIDLKEGSAREVVVRPRSDCATCAPLALDITGERCPMTYVRTKLRLETLTSGDVLRVRLREGEPLRNVPRSLREDGHAVLAIESKADGIHELRVRKQ